MKKLIIISFFYLVNTLAHAEIQIQIDPPEISQGESFRLLLTQPSLQSANGIPDLTPLRKDFIILGTERSVNYSVINGQTQASSTWIINLKARKIGPVTIPAIKMGGEQSSPLTINISPQDTSVQNSNDDQQQDIFLTTEVNEKKPYLNQQITYKVRLYNSKQLLDASYQGPKVDNALLIPLGNEKRYQTQKNNVTYLVEEQSYAIFPQKSGPLTITSPAFTALIYGFDPQRIKASSKDITLDVQPIPPQFSGQSWLPAKQIQLSDSYENSGQTIDQGSTLVRTITLEGVGIPAQLLPNLHFADSDAFKVYPEKGKEKNQVNQGEIVSRSEIKVTYLFNKSGKITIPELKLPWFNTVTGKEEIAVLAPRSIEVVPSKTTISKTSSPNQDKALAPQSIAEAVAAPSGSATTNNWGWIIAALFALAWLLTLSLWAWQRRSHAPGKKAYKRALQNLHDACHQNNPHRCRDALLKWANLHWPDAVILNLTDLIRLSTDMQFKKQVHVLSQALYQENEKGAWHGDELWRSVTNLKGTYAAPKNKENKASSLPPMNPA
ncbi:BatD family protein [Legionella saoudiensis]|uniref:BatD family protein n=1 Tax=Legionella saoudiensis TaxID=1750561 RepID=UPI000731293A|nr:BatD family protein [Legionella saoudiensis]